MNVRLVDIAIVGIFSALALAGAYLLLFVHNVEIFTAIIFLSGVLFGTRTGTLVGAISAALYAIINPFGISPLPLMVAQVVSRAVAGYVGGLFRDRVFTWKNSWLRAWCFGLAGFVLTWLYIALALLSNVLTAGFSLQQLKVSFAAGLISYTILTLGNTAIFALALPVVVDSLRKTSYFKPLRSS
ncbi:MAG: ECF transporter S component [bacterium]